MHSQSTNWTRNAIVVLTPLALIALLAVVLGPSLFDSAEPTTKLASAQFSTGTSTPTQAATTAATTAAAAQPATPRPTAAPAAKPKNPGKVKGTFKLTGPKGVPAGSLVVFVVDGKKRVVVKDEKAPYALSLNTKKLPNGSYTVSVLTSTAGRTATVSTSTLTVSNPKKKGKPGAPATTPASPKPDPANTPTPSPSTGGTKTERYAAEVLALTNAERTDAGCKALKVNAKLTKAAQNHSADMAKNNYFSHDSQDGRNPFDRMSAAGYSFGAAAENIAMGQQTPKDVVDAWMNSEGHRANILNCDYTELGVGYAVGNGSPYWTQDFGTPL